MPLWIALGLFALAVAFEASRPQPFDERLRLERAGGQPFDAEAFFRLLPGTLGAPVVPVEVTPFEHLADSTRERAAYVFLTDAFEPEAAEAGRLLAFAERGNTVFVSARVLGGPFFEALGVPDPDSLEDGVVALEWGELTGLGDLDGEDELVLFDEAVGGRFAMPLDVSSSTLRGLDSSRTDPLGADADWVDGDAVYLDAYTVNFARIRAGRGEVLVHGAPVVFTNAALAADSSDVAAYVAGVLSYLPPADTVFWDATYKPLRVRAVTRSSAIRQDPALRWGVALVLLGALFFVAFRGRRWQRPVPVVAPPPNAQREFARVLGRLHLVRGDRAWLAKKKARLVRDRLRIRYGLDAAELSDALARTAAARTGRPEADARALFARLRDLEADPAPSPERLLALDRDIEAFFREEVAEA